MPIISYAQNFEDVILYRALKSVDKGFYVDVGAMDPNDDSVTKAFYDLGWHGINIEPIETNFLKFLKARPLDININCLAGNYSGEAVFYEIVNTGLSTQDKDKAEEFSRNNGYDLIEHSLSIETLTNILTKVNPPIIHFLKIDVEGAEESVLRGTDLKQFRPWVIVIESTIPGSPIQRYSSWEPYLLSHSYDFAYFDGLNRFYVAHEKEDLIQSINLPPNVFDQFITNRELSNKNETYSILKLTENLGKSVAEGFSQQQIILENNQQLKQENSELLLKINSLHEVLEQALEANHQTDRKLAESESKLAVLQIELEKTITEKNTIESKFKETESIRVKIAEEKSALLIENQKLTSLVSRIQLLEEEKRILENEKNTIESKFKETESIRVKIAEDKRILENEKNVIESKFKDTESIRVKIAEEKHVLELSNQDILKDKQVLFDELMSVYSSKSFRLTRPLRGFGRGLRKFGGQVFGINYSKVEQPAVQDDSNDTNIVGNLPSEIENVSVGISDEKILDKEMTEDVKYYYDLLKDLMRGDK